jgi:hypothetical protein
LDAYVTAPWLASWKSITLSGQTARSHPQLLVANWGDTYERMLDAIGHYNETGNYLGDALRAIDRDPNNTLENVKLKSPPPHNGRRAR